MLKETQCKIPLPWLTIFPGVQGKALVAALVSLLNEIINFVQSLLLLGQRMKPLLISTPSK